MKTTKKDLKYYCKNAEEDYLTTPISVLRYISELEKRIKKLGKCAINNSVCPCKLPNGEIAISSKALQKHYGDLGQTTC